MTVCDVEWVATPPATTFILFFQKSLVFPFQQGYNKVKVIWKIKKLKRIQLMSNVTIGQEASIERSALTLVPAFADRPVDVNADTTPESLAYQDVVGETTKIAEAVTGRHERRAISATNEVILKRISHLRAQVEFITASLRAKDIEPPEDETYIGHGEVMNRVYALHLDDRLADISRADAGAIDTAFKKTRQRGETIRYNTDNKHFVAWIKSERPQEMDYINRFHRATHPQLDDQGRAIPIDDNPGSQRFMELYEEWWNTPESLKNACILDITSRQLDLDNIGAMSPEEALALRARLAAEARKLLTSESLVGWSDADILWLDAKIDYCELQLKNQGVQNVPEAMLDNALARLRSMTPADIADEDLERFVIKKGTTELSVEEQKEAANAYLKFLESYLEELQRKREQARLGQVTLELVVG